MYYYWCNCYFFFFFFFFFFQAEDGIRDGTVTGVQTCALPIYLTLPFIQTNDCCLDNRRSAGNGADNHELFRQRRALYVAVARMLDHFGDDDDSARRRFARKKCNAARDPRRNRTARARRESGAAVADRASRSIVARPDRTRCAPTFAWAAFGERGSGGNTRPPRNGSLRERSHSSRSDHRHRATTRFDWRGLWPGARFFPSRLEFRRIRYASDRARHC